MSIKDIRSQGVVQCGHFTDKLGLQMRTSALFDAKNFGFFEIYGVSVRTKGVRTYCRQCRHFADKGEREVNFSRVCADVFYGQPLVRLLSVSAGLLFTVDIRAAIQLSK